MRRPIARSAVASFVPLLALAACGGATSPVPDVRCNGVAQVPAWGIYLSGSLNDTGSVDSFRVRLHHTFSDTGTTRKASTAGSIYADGVVWKTRPLTGVGIARDTVINFLRGDTVAGSIARLSSPATWAVHVNLATCQAAIIGQPWGPMTFTLNGVAQAGVDTLQMGTAALFTFVDTAFVTGGHVRPAGKVETRSFGTTYPTSGPYYMAGVLVGPYAPAGVALDSATVAFSAVPLPTPAP